MIEYGELNIIKEITLLFQKIFREKKCQLNRERPSTNVQKRSEVKSVKWGYFDLRGYFNTPTVHFISVCYFLFWIMLLQVVRQVAEKGAEFDKPLFLCMVNLKLAFSRIRQLQ